MDVFLELSVAAASDTTFSATLRCLSQYNESLQRGPSHPVGPIKDWTEDFNQTVLGGMFPSSLGHVTIPDNYQRAISAFLMKKDAMGHKWLCLWPRLAGNR